MCFPFFRLFHFILIHFLRQFVYFVVHFAIFRLQIIIIIEYVESELKTSAVNRVVLDFNFALSMHLNYYALQISNV